MIGALASHLRPGGTFAVVEYDADRGNPWVPHPFRFATWERLAGEAGLAEARLLGRVPSRFLGADLLGRRGRARCVPGHGLGAGSAASEVSVASVAMAGSAPEARVTRDRAKSTTRACSSGDAKAMAGT